MRKTLEWLKKLIDPQGPAGEFLSTDSFFKEHIGLPYEAGIRQRSEPAPIAIEEIQKACLPERYYAKGEIEVPYSRERQVSPYVTERYHAVLKGMEIVGWRVTQEPRSPFCDCQRATWTREGGQFVHTLCGRRRAPVSDAELVEKIQTIQIQPGEAMYYRYAETIPGKDTTVAEGVTIKGGTQLQGRRHYKQLTKDWVHWDAGVPKEKERAHREQNEKRMAETKKKMARLAHKIISDRPSEI